MVSFRVVVTSLLIMMMQQVDGSSSSSSTAGFTFLKNVKVVPDRLNRNKIKKQQIQDVLATRFGDTKLVVVSDVTSDLGQQTVQMLLQQNKKKKQEEEKDGESTAASYTVIGGVPTVHSASFFGSSCDNDNNAKIVNNNFIPIEYDTDSFASIQKLVTRINELRMDSKPIDRLVVIPTTTTTTASSTSTAPTPPAVSKDGYDIRLQREYLAPSLITSALLDSVTDSFDGRVTMVTTSNNANQEENNIRITGDDPKLSFLHDLFRAPEQEDAKTTETTSVTLTTKRLQKLLFSFLHTKYFKLTQTTFNTYELPTTTAATTKDGLYQLIHDPTYAGELISGKSFTTKEDAKTAATATAVVEVVNDTSNNNSNDHDNCNDMEHSYQLFQWAEKVTNNNYPEIKKVTSPCPTLKVVGAITKGQLQKQEMKRMQELGRPGMANNSTTTAATDTKEEHAEQREGEDVPDGTSSTPPKRTKVKRTMAKKIVKQAFVKGDVVFGFVFKHTVKRTARVVSNIVLGKIVNEATTGSYGTKKEAKPEEENTNPEEHDHKKDSIYYNEQDENNDILELQEIIASQITKEQKNNIVNSEDKIGNKKLVVVTGASSGLGRKTALALVRSGEYHVIGAVRDIDKMEAVAEVDEFDTERFTPMYCEMNSFESVKEFCNNVNTFRGNKKLDRLVCNAGVYQPSLRYAKWSKDGHEQTMQINYLSHFLMISILMKQMKTKLSLLQQPPKKNSEDDLSRVIVVGSVTGNDNTVGGGGVYPIADLHDLDGFKGGFENPIEMADGYGFVGAKAYKDSKLCLMVLANYLHAKYHDSTGITFCSLYPGCIAESPLFREKRPFFRKLFPIFMKFITGGYVSEHEAGQRLYQVCHDPRCGKRSGVYWSWNGGPREGRGAEAIEKGGQISGGGGAGGGWDSIYENDQSLKVLDVSTGYDLFYYSNKITDAQWMNHPNDIMIKTNINDLPTKQQPQPQETNQAAAAAATTATPTN